MSRCSASWKICASRLQRYAVFVCPILSGSGVRVKLLEAFAAGFRWSRRVIGAEGLARKDGEFCALADDPDEFADHVSRAVARSRSGGGNGRARARRGGGQLGHGRDHSAWWRSYREVVREKAE